MGRVDVIIALLCLEWFRIAQVFIFPWIYTRSKMHIIYNTLYHILLEIKFKSK